jgi:hypothetical protein
MPFPGIPVITLAATLRIWVWPAPPLAGATTLVGRCLVRPALAVRSVVHPALARRCLVHPALAVQT